MDVVYPASSSRLWARLETVGGILSEAAPGAAPEGWRFPLRNRLIAALAHVVVVVESHRSGGALHTVTAADDRGVTVLAVPGSVRSPASEGTIDSSQTGAASPRTRPTCSRRWSLHAPGRAARCGQAPAAGPARPVLPPRPVPPQRPAPAPRDEQSRQAADAGAALGAGGVGRRGDPVRARVRTVGPSSCRHGGRSGAPHHTRSRSSIGLWLGTALSERRASAERRRTSSGRPFSRPGASSGRPSPARALPPRPDSCSSPRPY